MTESALFKLRCRRGHLDTAGFRAVARAGRLPGAIRALAWRCAGNGKRTGCLRHAGRGERAFSRLRFVVHGFHGAIARCRRVRRRCDVAFCGCRHGRAIGNLRGKIGIALRGSRWRKAVSAAFVAGLHRSL